MGQNYIMLNREQKEDTQSRRISRSEFKCEV